MRIAVNNGNCWMGTGFWFLQEEMTGDRDKFALLWGEAQLCLPYVC